MGYFISPCPVCDGKDNCCPACDGANQTYMLPIEHRDNLDKTLNKLRKQLSDLESMVESQAKAYESACKNADTPFQLRYYKGLWHAYLNVYNFIQDE